MSTDKETNGETEKQTDLVLEVTPPEVDHLKTSIKHWSSSASFLRSFNPLERPNASNYQILLFPSLNTCLFDKAAARGTPPLECPFSLAKSNIYMFDPTGVKYLFFIDRRGFLIAITADIT